MESSSWAIELHPTITDVTSFFLSSHANAIWANDWSLDAAMWLRFVIFSIIPRVRLAADRNLPAAARESAGMPWRYLLVSNPWAKGENAMKPMPEFSRSVSIPEVSGARSKMLSLS